MKEGCWITKIEKSSISRKERATNTAPINLCVAFCENAIAELQIGKNLVISKFEQEIKDGRCRADFSLIDHQLLRVFLSVLRRDGQRPPKQGRYHRYKPFSRMDIPGMGHRFGMGFFGKASVGVKARPKRAKTLAYFAHSHSFRAKSPILD